MMKLLLLLGFIKLPNFYSGFKINLPNFNLPNSFDIRL